LAREAARMMASQRRLETKLEEARAP
jgi:hypothetical protein